MAERSDLPSGGVQAPPAAGPAPEAPPVTGARRRGALRRALGNPRVAWAAALVFAAAAALLASWWAPLHLEARDREDVRAVAGQLALRLTTFEGADIEAWVQQAQALSTGEYAREITVLFDQEFRDALREAEAVSRGEVIDLFVQDVDGDEAVAFAVVRQVIANAHIDEPVQDELRMEIRLRRVDGRWRASDVHVLPSAGGPAPGGAGGLAAPEPPQEPASPEAP